MKNILTLVLSFLASFSFSQPAIEWQESFGGHDYYFPAAFQETPDEGFIIVGTTGNPDDSLSNVWVLKMNADKTVAWEKSLGGSGQDAGYAIHQTSDGGYIIGGETHSNDGDVSGHHGKSDFWVVKLDEGGLVQWQQTFGGTEDDQLGSIQQTSDGGYIVCGKSNSNDEDVSGNHGLHDIWLVKLVHTGDIEWSKSLGGSEEEYGGYVRQTADGGFILAAYSDSSDGDLSTNAGHTDIWIVKLDDAGEIEWQRSFGGSGGEAVRSIHQTTDGGYIIGGLTNSDDGDVTYNHGIADCWVLKIDPAGNLEWQQTYGGTDSEIVTGLSPTSDNGAIFCALTYSNNDQVPTNYGMYDCWIVKLNEIGNLVWQKLLGGSSLDRANDVLQTADGGFSFVASTFSQDGHLPAISLTGSTAWIVKLSGTSDIGDPNTPITGSLNVFPNPASNFIRVKLDGNTALVTAQFLDISGKMIAAPAIDSAGNIDVSGLANGVYLLRVTDSNGTQYTKEIVKQ